MDHLKGFIRYQTRSQIHPDIIYGSYCVPRWIDGKKNNDEIWLGRVIDKPNGIFFSKKHNYFQFTLDDHFRKLTAEEVIKYSREDTNPYVKKGRSLELDELKLPENVVFGNSFIIDSFINTNNAIKSILDFIPDNHYDTLLSLVCYKITSDNGYRYAENWWNSNYSRLLYPKADLKSQGISEFLTDIGSDCYFRSFFTNYLKYFGLISHNNTMQLDITGLINEIKIPIIPCNNRNNEISNEIRLITLYDKITNLPIYYRSVPGDVVDVSTLKFSIDELPTYGLNINRLIIDDKYYSEDFISELVDLNTNFIAKMDPRNDLYNTLITNIIPSIKKISNFVQYSDKPVFIQKEKINIFKSQIPILVYVCLDVNVCCEDSTNYYNHFDPTNTINEQFELDNLKHGVSILISSLDLDPKEFLSFYYSRQSVNQFFDYLKNDIDLLILSTNSTNTFKGHMLLCFISSIIYILIHNQLTKRNISFSESLVFLSNHIARVYKNRIKPDVTNKAINDTLKALNLKIPRKILTNKT